MVDIIYASTDSGLIGGNNKLLWHIPADLKFFSDLTVGRNVLVGRKTFESLPPQVKQRGRTFYVLTSNPSSVKSHLPFIPINQAELDAILHDKDKYFICIGGAQLYKMVEPYATRIYHTLIRSEVEFTGDAYFKIPHYDWDCFCTTPTDTHTCVLTNAEGKTYNALIFYKFITYIKKQYAINKRAI